MQKYKYITLLFVVLFLVGCAKDDFITIGDSRGEKAVYGFGVGGGTTRTFINDDGVTISWDKDDKVALWAKANGSDSYTLSNKIFDTWFVSADNSQAYFTAELDSQMPDSGDENKNDDYTYYVCYPLPQSVSGTTATFNLPSTQDGKMGGGADIMVGEGEGPALAKLYNPESSTPDYVIKDGVKLQMKHLIHALRFYVPQGKWGFPQGETVERIEFTMPDNVAGTVTADVAAESPALSSPTNATNTISLNLKEPIGPSAADGNGVVNYDYACASIIPNTYSGDMTVKVYSQTKASQVTIPINNRAMAANHITPVGLNCLTVTERPKISFRIESNNLGEQPYKITLTSEDPNTKWKAGDDHVYEYYTGSESSTIAKGGGFDLYTDEEVLESILNKSVTVTYESKSAIVTEKITIKQENVGGNNPVKLKVPYLFAEDFGSIADYGFDVVTGAQGTAIDGYDLSVANPKKDNINPNLIPGWTGARTGGSSGKAIRVGSRVDQVYGMTHTYGRLDSPVLSCIKDGVKVKINVSFNYSGGRDGRSEYSPRAVFGYTTISGPINGKTGSFSSDADNWENISSPQLIPSISTSGSFDKITQSATFELDNCENDYRLSWQIRGTGKMTGLVQIGNGNQWMFIDNIKVQIVK